MHVFMRSAHDACVYRRSNFIHVLNDVGFLDNSHVLGDSAYPLTVNTLVPFKDNGHLTNIHNQYNEIHASTRVVIEPSFGLLK